MLIVVWLLALETIPAPPVISRERGSIVATDRRRVERWTADWTMEPWREKDRAAVRFTETGRGHFSPYVQPIQWTIEAVWAADGSFYPLRFQKDIKDMNGRLIATERKVFDASTHKVRFERQGEVKELRAPPDTMTVEGIAGILRFLPFDHWHPQTVHFLTNEPRLYEMKIEMKGKERVKTPAGEFECYTIELIPSLGVLNVIRSFLPKARFWFSASQPHFWVRYEGPENGPGSPDIVTELKNYTH
jgi:hypothetical protein